MFVMTLGDLAKRENEVKTRDAQRALKNGAGRKINRAVSMCRGRTPLCFRG